MSATEVISITLNFALAMACMVLVVRARRAKISAAVNRQFAQDTAAQDRRKAEAITTEYLSLGESIAEALEEVRMDIDRSYQHTHEGHLLGRIAHEFEKARGPILLDEFLEEEIRLAGGGKFIFDGELLFSGALQLAWHLHAEARKSASELYVVTKESCGETNRAAWLAKSLALYQRICGDDKHLAISSLSNVLEHWRFSNLNDAVQSHQAA